MAYSVDWVTKIVTIPQADLVFVSTALYEININDIRIEIRGIEASEEGIVFDYPVNNPDGIIAHTAPQTVAGVTLARVVEFINGFTVTFENGMYGVNIINGNSNIADVLNRNQVSVNTSNSAGAIVVNAGIYDANILSVRSVNVSGVSDFQTNIGPLL